MAKFKQGDKVRCIDICGAGLLKLGAVYTVAGTGMSTSIGEYVTLAEVSQRPPAEGFFASRFESAPAIATQPVEQNISTEFEIRWHKTPGKLAQPIGVTDGRVLARRASQQLAEDFITQNAGNYAAGEFSITQVTVLKRVKHVRRVKRVPVTSYKLEDA
ncbi:hypothetical protein [Burkholderia cenocepacia]|uniref:hypothetical protein n=1 Tax=Burkholderia cenocepacia TaxID=95486 RepID=UPI002AAFF2B1|nr:hypothetical protein [Burkholderia cenocepacia]